MNLATRLFITLALLIAFAVGAAIGLSYWLSRSTVANQVNATFMSSQSVQRNFLEQELRELELAAELIASDRAFVAYVAQALGSGENDTIDTLSINDLLDERSSEYGFDFAFILSPGGQTLVTNGDLVAVGADLSRRSGIADAINSLQPYSGLWIEPERVLEFAIAPLINGRTVQAYLVTGTEITDDYMNRISRASGIEMAYVSLQGGQASIAASTLQLNEQDDLAAQFSAHQQLAGQIINNTGNEPIELSLAGQKWITQVSILEGNENTGRLLSLVPHAELFRTFREISNVLLLAGLAAIALALIVSVTAARRMLKPIESLANHAENATRGQYRGHISITGSEEIQRLQRAFNHLVSDLRENVAATSYFEELSQKQPLNLHVSSSQDKDRYLSDGLQELSTGHVLGDRYEVLNTLGHGGMGIVYEAIDRELNEVIALKTLRRELASDYEKVLRLKSEIRLARRITHPNVVRTYDFARVDGIPLISMELVRGVSLEDAIRNYGRVEFYACIRMAIQICDGVSAAHRAGVLHRDLKPGNVMITNLAKVMDFGIAYPTIEHQSNSDATGIDASEAFEGTPTYLSPEQLLGEELDERSDIYSLGILFTEMFTGHIPHTDTDTKVIFDSHLNRKLLLPSDLWPDIPTGLEATILQCLERSRQDRWQTVEELRNALDAFRLHQAS